MSLSSFALQRIVWCVFFLISTTSSAAEPLKKATFIPLWLPQAQFAGYYMAAEKGIYLKHGIDLTIITGGPGHSPAEYLRDGRADFAALWLTTALQRRDEGLPLVNIAQVVQQSSMLLIAHKDSSIRTPADLNGKKVGLWGGDFDIPPNSLFDQYGLKVKPVQQSVTVNLFLRGGIAAASAMLYNEYHTILNAGLNADELTVFPLKDHGANYPEDGLYALQKTIEGDPQMVKAFVRASLEGWEYAFAHPEETVDVMLRIIKEARQPANRMHQHWMLARMQELMRPAGPLGNVGKLDQKDYQVVAHELRRRGLVGETPDYENFVKVDRELR